MKTLLALACAGTMTLSAAAQVEVLPPDFTLFDKTGSDYVPDWFQFQFSLPGDNDYYLPNAGPLNDERIFFLQLVSISLPTRPGIQNYYVPDDVYFFFPIFTYHWDNINVVPPQSVEELRDTVTAIIETVEEVQVTIDGVAVPNMLSYRYPSPVFSVFLTSTNNLLTPLYGHPLEGLIYPLVADGFFLMLAPLPAGPHDVKTRIVWGGPTPRTSGREYRINVLTPHEYLAYQAAQIIPQVNHSPLPFHRQHPLLVSLEAARESFSAGNLAAAANQLAALKNKLRAQVAPGNPALADALTQAVDKVINKARLPQRE